VIPFPFDMSGKTVVVTGSTRGIGRALAKGFHACGARTIISSNMQDDVGLYVFNKVRAGFCEGIAASRTR
jgi:NAD(P)-dependent dehydrogenase (short-subunit alcohol dehydrogenase family)